MNKIEQLKARGFNLMPLKEKSKFPILPEWTPLKSQMYTGKFPDRNNVAVICGAISNNLFVLDLDNESLYDEFPEYHGKTYTVRTGKRGVHLYFRTHGLPIENRKLDDARGRHIDIQSEGKYVLAEGSIHPDTGKMYEAICNEPVMIIDFEELKTKLKNLGFKIEKLTYNDIEKGISAGGRNDATFKYACYLIRDKGLYGKALEKELEDLNSRHTPPLPKNELNVIMESALKYESHTIRPHKKFASIEEFRDVAIDYFSKNNVKKVNLLDAFPEYINTIGEDLIKKIIFEYIDPEMEFSMAERVPISKVNPDYEGKIIEFDGMVIAVGEKETYTKEADIMCPTCMAVQHIKCNEYRLLTMPKCKADNVLYKVIHSSKITGYIQQLRIQEFMEDAINNSPQEIDAEIIDSHVGDAFFGDRKTFAAKFRSITPLKVGQEYNKIVYEIVEMKEFEQTGNCMPEQWEIDNWKADPNIFDRVRDSIAPEQYMTHINELKESGMLAVVGGMSLNGKRDNINVAWLGDGQLGKSETLKAVLKLVAGSGYAVGGRVSTAGLTTGMVKMYNGTSIPQAGFLPRHHMKPVGFDEADKAKPQDIQSLYECLEQGTCTVTLAGTNGGFTLPASCPLIMCANPIGGKYNTKLPRLLDNFDFPEPFITRFDLLFLVTDSNSSELDDKITGHIKSFDKSKYMSQDELRRYFAYARSLKATIPKELEYRIDQIYKKLRPLNKEGTIPIGIRQYYGLYRLLTACASCNLRETVNESDFDRIENMIYKSLESFGIDVKTGQVKDTFRKKKDSRYVFLMETWSQCMDNNGLVDKKEFINAISGNELCALNPEMYFDQLERAGTIKLDNDTGLYRMEGK